MKEGIHVIEGSLVCLRKRTHLYIKKGWIFSLLSQLLSLSPKKEKHLHKNLEATKPWNPSMIPPSPPVAIFSAEASFGQVYLESQLCGRFDLCHCLQWPTGRVQLSAPWEKVWERTVLLCLQPGKCRGRKIWNMHRVRKKLHRLPCTLW